jgi:hypothetical protein
MPFTGILDSANFDIREFNLPNDRNFLLTRELDGEKLVITCDVEYVRRFTMARDFKIYMDGTFKTSSTSFYQVYIIHGEFNNQSFPLIFCFLSSKTEEAYTNVFNLIKSSLASLSVEFSPSVIQIDFEVAAFNAVRNCFPNAQVKGCFFHFGQAIWRRVQRLGLVSLYNEAGHFADLIQMISALALIPSEDIDNAWMIIRSRFTEYDSNVEFLLEYVDNNWLCNLRPFFSRDVWSHHGILRGRTNNAAEGFHSKLSKLINKTNSCFSEVLNTLKEIQMSNEVELHRLIAGGVPKRRKKSI